MAIVMVGGHSRSVGKTSVAAGLIKSLPEFNWTAFKITQFGHGICSANGEPCDCATHDDLVAISREKDRSGKTDTSRFLAAGAKDAFWVRTRQGRLAEAMPRLRPLLAACENAVIESNSARQFLRPDLYLLVIDPATADFKDSARIFLDHADAILALPGEHTWWSGVSSKLLRNKPVIPITREDWVTDKVIRFTKERLSLLKGEPFRAR